MDLKTLLLYAVFCIVMVKTEKGKSHITTQDKRIKRSKYYDSPPPGAKVYRRPSYGFPPRTIISNTPPPNYRTEEEPPYPQPPRTHRKPEGLGDEDINNIIKFLSKQDLDKIISFAGARERDSPSKKVTSERDGDYEFQNQAVLSQRYEGFSQNGPYIKSTNDQDKNFQVDYYGPSSSSIQEVQKYINTAPVINIPDGKDSVSNYQQVYLGNTGNDLRSRYQSSNTILDTQESIQSFAKVYDSNLAQGNNFQTQYQTSNGQSSEGDFQKYAKVFDYGNNNQYQTQMENQRYVQTYQKVYGDDVVKDQEEVLPRPVNLREDIDEAIDAAQTRQVAAIARPDPEYKVESFGDLPVMNYHSKMFSVSSYNVPHYTVSLLDKYTGEQVKKSH